MLDVYLAILARISENDAVQTIKLQSQGASAVVDLVKSKSVLDQDWSEQLVGQVLNEIYRIFS